MNIDTIIKKWQEEFAFCQQQEIFNTQNKEYITAHNHAVRKEQIHLFIKDLQQVKNNFVLPDVTASALIKFGAYLTGHDESTIEQMLNDYNQHLR